MEGLDEFPQVLEGIDEFPQVLEEYITCTDSIGDGMEYNIYCRGVSYYEQIIWFNITQASVKPDN